MKPSQCLPFHLVINMKTFFIMALAATVLLAALALSSAYPVDDSQTAAGHHGGHHHGRVQIKVYRGQSKPHGYEYFAPYGYWVRQPPDNHGYHGHH